MRADSEELEGEGRMKKKVPECKDCEHSMGREDLFCVRSEFFDRWRCRTEREWTGKNYCGPTGKFFKLKVDA